MDASISTTLQHTITFLLNPLLSHFPSTTLDALHNSLLSSFSSLTTTRLSNSPHQFLLSPTAPAPAIIQRAINALPPHLRVQWSDWILLLGNGNQVVLSITLNPGLVTTAIRSAHTGLVDFTTIWDAAASLANTRQRTNRIPSHTTPWGPQPSLLLSATTSRSRSSAESTSSNSEFEDMEFSSSSRSSSPDVVAVEAAENVLSGVYDDDDDEDQFRYGRLGAAFGGLSLHQQPASHMSIGMNTVKAPVQLQQQKTSLRAAAAEWFPRGAAQQHAKTASIASLSNFASSFPAINIQPTQSGSSTGSNVHTSPSRLLPTPIGAHRSQPGHSRSSSRSSTLSMGTAPSLTSTSTSSTHAPVPASPTPSEESVDLYIDASKDQQAVTEYECGKVGVLTGAVMLGVPKNSVAGGAAGTWRKQRDSMPAPMPVMRRVC
ncbi:hypothetical protein FRB94_006248 [Tulasnella sp. JGI-2019a]|nr:hypothetical protein FRB94_006248 [Tulasnella sp. JGI-2019a]KAG9016466.1 hypothetical protein FRB93_010715 [Tulasnella sp. JGI-2019a]